MRRIDLAPYLPDERSAVDPVRERAANKLVSERRVSVRSELDGELLECRACRRDQPNPRLPPNGRDDRWWNAHGDVELAAPQLVAGIGSRRRESDDEPLDVGWVRSPVAGVAPKDELPAALEPLDEERATSDGSTRPRIIDPVAPDLREVRTAERVRRQDVPEEVAPARGPRPENHSQGLAIDGARTPDGGVEVTELRRGVTAYRPEREDEVLRRDRDSVAPARLGMDVIGQCEWSPPREVDPRDEAFLVREVGTDVERLLQNLVAQTACPPGLQLMGRAFRHAGSGPSRRMTSVPPRFGVCAARRPLPRRRGARRRSPRRALPSRTTSS